MNKNINSFKEYCLALDYANLKLRKYQLEKKIKEAKKLLTKKEIKDAIKEAKKLLTKGEIKDAK